MSSETRKLDRPDETNSAEEFFQRFSVTLVMTEGKATGSEFVLDRESVVLGRGPGVDLNFDDTSMSRAHASFELTQDGFRVRDMASTNGVHLNGTRVQSAELKHGDRLELGEHCFQYLVEERVNTPSAYVLNEA
jgi:pSer/pThr/pTyr-binding forkhead associated (FHA) protein